jgi:hypothetical protein
MKQILTHTTVGLALSLLVLGAVGTHAEPLAKSGTGTCHYGSKGIGSTTPSGDKRMYWTGTYWGVSFNDEGKGLLHQVAWNCPNLTTIDPHNIQAKGACAGTDTDGDKIYGDWTSKVPVGGESPGSSEGQDYGNDSCNIPTYRIPPG